MIYRTERKANSQGLFTKFWNEFLFAREFEYETPLTPDEIIDALTKLEDQEHRAWYLTHARLVHKVTYNRLSDKSGDFLIELESADRGKWWETNSAMQEVEGTISVDPETGLSTVRGRTRFNRNYYILFLTIYLSSMLAQTTQNTLFSMTVWIIVVITFWFVMYRERNKFANRVDHVIMNAKSDHGNMRLRDDDLDRFSEFETVKAAQQGYR